MRHLDLFSGIGGFALAAREAWGSEHEIVGFCDNDSFCQNVLAKNFPGVPIYGDIRELTRDRLAADAISPRARVEKQGTPGSFRKHAEALAPTLVRQGNGTGDAKRASPHHRNVRIDLLTGGFPCQPFSNAGKKRGDKDDRYLWPEMLRVIRETRPAWIIGENVAGIISMALDQVCADLEGEGYEVQPFVIPAAAVGAPHRRDRVWIVAHRDYERNGGIPGIGEGARAAWKGKGTELREEYRHQAGNEDTDDPHPTRGGLRQEHSDDRGRESGTGTERIERFRSAFSPFERSEWSRDWRQVALETCHDRVDDGLPQRLVRFPDGSEISPSRHRRESLKAYGNAIVPQVAAEIMKAIKQISSSL